MDIPLGKLYHGKLSGGVTVPYFVYRPNPPTQHHRVLVAVHGISRKPAELVEAFIPHAEKYGVVLVAPLFDEDDFRGFQRLGLRNGQNADVALRRVLDEVAALTDTPTERFYLFGHSGGAQFTHRYAMVHPEEVIRYAVSAAGWYTAPDLALEYPYGMKAPPGLPDVYFDIERFLRIPACVLVGEYDTERDDALNKSEFLDTSQGATRKERAEQWVSAMTTAARWRGLDARFTLHVLPGSSHDFKDVVRNGQLADLVFRSFF